LRRRDYFPTTYPFQADCPIVITECVGNCSASPKNLVDDMGWYDQTLVRATDYVLGVATWNIGNECNTINSLQTMSTYVCTDVLP
jgi:hypothetical protein